MTTTFIPADARTIVAQIGRGNIMAISGGRVLSHETGIILPVSHGYRVTVDLAANDTYTVRRWFVRGAKTWIKKEWVGVHADEIGETSYRASCFRD